MQSRTGSTGPLACFARASTCLFLGIQMITVGVALPFSVAAAAGESEAELAASRDQWQGNYRRLLRNKATLNENIAKSENDYAQAQRRNYPRGGARQMLLTRGEQAKVALVETEKEIAALIEDARRQGVPPGWLDEVASEEIVAFQPAAPSGDRDEEQDEEQDDREGRNPLYLDDED